MKEQLWTFDTPTVVWNSHHGKDLEWSDCTFCSDFNRKKCHMHRHDCWRWVNDLSIISFVHFFPVHDFFVPSFSVTLSIIQCPWTDTQLFSSHSPLFSVTDFFWFLRRFFSSLWFFVPWISGYTEIEAIEGRETFLPCMTTSLTDVSPVSGVVSSSTSVISNSVNAVRMTESTHSTSSSSMTTVTGGTIRSSKNNNKIFSTREEPALIIWYRGNSGIPIFTVDARNATSLRDSTQISSTEYEGRVEFDSRLIPPALRIKSIYVEDEGEYRCRCDFRKSRSQNFLLNLTVIGKIFNLFPPFLVVSLAFFISFSFASPFFTLSLLLFTLFDLCESLLLMFGFAWNWSTLLTLLMHCTLFLIHFLVTELERREGKSRKLTKCEFPGDFEKNRV